MIVLFGEELAGIMARRAGIATLVAICATTGACTRTHVEGLSHKVDLGPITVGRIEVAYGRGLAGDRLRRAQQLRVAERLERRLADWLVEVERWGGDRIVSIEVERFRLPAVARGFTGSLKGSDYLGVRVALLADQDEVLSFGAEQVLGAGDRSVAANYSETAALRELIDSIAWSILLEVTPVPERKAVFDIGKRAEVPRAIQLLEECGELSYLESVGFSAKGLIPFSTAAGAETRRLKRAFGGTLPRCY